VATGLDPCCTTTWSAGEGRDPNAWFAHDTDVAAAGLNALDHYQAVGWKEGRDAPAHFDTAGYLAAHPDVAAAGATMRLARPARGTGGTAAACHIYSCFVLDKNP
jgi:hypothetical protein